MKKNETWFLVLFSVFAVLVFAVAISLRDRANGGGVARTVGNPAPDSIVVSPGTDGDESVTNKTAGYFFSIPANWYVEKSAGAGLAVYPDYDPKGSAGPECKIEMSVLAASSTGLNAWITAYLHADPTADVVEISRAAITIGSGVADSGATTSSAIEWNGLLNGVSTTLVYVAIPHAGDTPGDAGENILELAPSTLAGADDCGLALQALMANLNFDDHAP